MFLSCLSAVIQDVEDELYFSFLVLRRGHFFDSPWISFINISSTWKVLKKKLSINLDPNWTTFIEFTLFSCNIMFYKFATYQILTRIMLPVDWTVHKHMTFHWKYCIQTNFKWTLSTETVDNLVKTLRTWFQLCKLGVRRGQ